MVTLNSSPLEQPASTGFGSVIGLLVPNREIPDRCGVQEVRDTQHAGQEYHRRNIVCMVRYGAAREEQRL